MNIQRSWISVRAVGFCLLTSVAGQIGLSDRAWADSIRVADINNINAGINFPRESERFFEEGRRQMEQEVRTLAQPELISPDILQTDETLPQVLDEQRLQLEDPQLHLDQNQSGTWITGV